MMSLSQFVAWAGKAENGGVPAAEATAEWKEKHADPNSVTDSGGRYKDSERVAISIQDLIILRDTSAREQSYMSVILFL